MRSGGESPDLMGLVPLEEETPQSLRSLCYSRAQAEGSLLARKTTLTRTQAAGTLTLDI